MVMRTDSVRNVDTTTIGKPDVLVPGGMTAQPESKDPTQSDQYQCSPCCTVAGETLLFLW